MTSIRRIQSWPSLKYKMSADIEVAWANFDDYERIAILNVLRRDAILRHNELLHIRRLKAELQQLRKRGALKASETTTTTTTISSSNGKEDGDGHRDSSSSRSCARCRIALGRIINRGAICKTCRQRVCKSCRDYQRANEWVCSLCYKNAQVQAVSGEWMNSLVRQPSRRKNSKDYVAAGDIVARGIRRSWTISSPSSSKELPPSAQLQAYKTLEAPRKFHPKRDSGKIPDENQPPMDWQQRSDSRFPSNTAYDSQVKGHERVAPRRSASLSQADAVFFDDNVLPTCKSNASSTRLFYDDHQRSDRKQPIQSGYDEDRLRGRTAAHGLDAEDEVVWKSRWRSSSPPPVLEDWVPIKPPHLAWAKAVPVETTDDSRQIPRRRPMEPQSRRSQLKDDFIPRSVSGEMIYLERDPDAPYVRQRTLSIDRGTLEPMPYKTYEEELRDYKIRTGSVDRLALRGRQGRGIRMGTRSQVGRSVPTSLERRGSEPSREAYQRRRESDSSSSSNNRPVQRRSSSAATDFSNSSSGGASAEQSRVSRADDARSRQQQGRNVNRVYIDAPDDRSEANQIKVTMIDSRSLQRPAKNANNSCGSSTIPRTGKRSSSREHFGSTTVYLEAPSPPCSAPEERQPSATTTRDTAAGSSCLKMESGTHNKDYDIESLTGAIFHKVTVKRRKQEPSHLDGRRLGEQPMSVNSPLATRRTTHSLQEWRSYIVRTVQTCDNPLVSNDPHENEYSEMQDAAVQTSGLTSEDETSEYTFHDSNADTPSAREDSPLLPPEDRRSFMASSETCSAVPCNSDTASDIVLDTNKIVPEGDDYKLVFISSDSSKSSLEESFEASDQSPVHSRNPSSVNESDTGGFIDESDWDMFSSGLKKIAEQNSRTKGKTRHNSSSDESKVHPSKNINRKVIRSKQPLSENDCKSSTLGSMTSSDNNSPRTFLIDDFNYAWDHSHEHLAKTVPAPASAAADQRQHSQSHWSIASTEDEKSDPVTYTTREVQTDADMTLYDMDGFEMVDRRTNASPTRSLEEWETMSHIRASRVSTPACLSRNFSLLDESNKSYVPIWQISTSSRASNQSLHNLLSTCIETQTETQSIVNMDQSGARRSHFNESSFLISAAKLDDSYAYLVEPPGGGSFTDSPGADYVRSSQDYRQSVRNRYFSRSDSKRSSGERSLEEFSFHDHILAHDNVISSLYSPDGLALPGFQEYRDRILTEIQAYTAKGDWNLVAPEKTSLVQKNDNYFVNSSNYQGDKKVWHDLNAVKKSAISRAKLGNYCVWPTGSRLVPNSVKRWRSDEAADKPRDFHAFNRQTAAAEGSAALLSSGVSVESRDDKQENSSPNSTFAEKSFPSEVPEACVDILSSQSSNCESSQHSNRDWNFSFPNNGAAASAQFRALDMSVERDIDQIAALDESSPILVEESEDKEGKNSELGEENPTREPSGSNHLFSQNEYAQGVSDFSWSEAREKPSNLGLDPEAPGSLVSPTLVDAGLKESVADSEEHLAGVSPRLAQPIHLFLALSRQCSVTGEEEGEEEEEASNPSSHRQDNKTSQCVLSQAQLSQPGSENPQLKGQSPNERDPGSAQLRTCAMETHAISTSPHNATHENSHTVERQGETEQDAHSDETGSGESAPSLESHSVAEKSDPLPSDDALAEGTLICDDSLSQVNNTDLVRLDGSQTVEALNSNVTLPDQQPLAVGADESSREMTVRATASKTSAAQQEDSSAQSRFQVSTVDAKLNPRLLSDSDVTTSGDEGESPSFDTDSQQETVIEGHSQAFQDLRQFALKHSLALARKDCSLSPTPPTLFDVSDAHQSDTDSSSSRCSLRPSSFPASPVPSDGRLTPRRAQGQYTSYVLITQEESESQKPEKVISDDESRVTVTVPQPSNAAETPTVCVVEVPAQANWMESHDENTDSESQDITEDSASCVTVSGNGVLTDHDIEDETSADEDTLTDHVENSSNLAKYFTLALETGFSARRKQPVVYRNPERARSSSPDPFSEDLEEKADDGSIDQPNLSLESTEAPLYESDLSEKIDSIDETESNYSESASSGDEAYFDREEELRGYNRAIDFTLHTILEESCEESDSERRSRSDSHNPQTNPSELEKYFTFDLGGGVGSDPSENKRRTSFANEESEYSDTFSETSSSIYSEGLEVRSGEEEDIDPVELASSRLEKYFMTGFLGLEQGQYPYGATGLTSGGSDGSESVGSDSEGQPSPEQRRRKVVRARGSRQQASPHSGYRSSERKEVSSSGEVSHSSAASEAPEDDSADKKGASASSSEVSDFSSSEAEDIVFEKNDGQFDTIKRRKKKRSAGDHDIERIEKKSTEEPVVLPEPEAPKEETRPNDELSGTADANPEEILDPDSPRKYQSRDSGFVGSCDDLLNDSSTPSASVKDIRKRISSESGSSDSSEGKNSANSGVDELNQAKNDENDGGDTKSGKSVGSSGSSGEAAGSLTSTSQSSRSGKLSRKDSFNNWSSDEETNLMMSKMKAFFRNMVSGGGGLKSEENGQRVKPPQLLAFENELTRLMKTVPGINDEQVKEIVEYLSSEDTWSDSYDSSDYTSSDLEGAYAVLDPTLPELDVKSDLQQQISASCQEIIAKFELNRSPDGSNPSVDILGLTPWMPAGEDPSNSLNKETAFVYQRLVNSLMRLNNGPKIPPETTETAGEAKTPTQSPHNSPPMIAKVLQHIGNKLVALMHEVSASSDTTSHSGSIDEDAQSAGRMKEIRMGFEPVTSSPRLNKLPRRFLPKDRSANDDANSLNSTSIESEESPTDTEQSPDSDDHTQPNRESTVLKYGYENVHYEKRMSSLPSQFGSEGKSREDQRGFSSLESAESRGIIGGSRSLKARLAERARTLESERRRAEEKRSGSASGLAEEDTAEDEEDRYVKKERKLPRFSLFRTSRDLQSSSSGVSDIAEEKEDEFSGWRSSFESAIAADSRTKLSLEAKRRSGGSASSSELFASNDHLLDREARRVRSSGHSSKFSLPNLLERDAVRSAKERERERERSASSDVLLSTSPIASNTMLSVIDQQEDEDTDWDRLVLTRLSSKRRSSVPDTREERAGEKSEPRSTTLPRSTTALHAVEAEIDLNSSPSISASTAGVKKSLSMLLNSSANSASESSLNTSADTPIRSARYRPPGFRPQPPAATRTQRAPSSSGLQVNTTPRWSTAPLSHRRNVRSMLADDRSDSTSSPSFVREGLRTSVASAASGESFSSVSAADTNDENELSVSANKPRSSSLSALGIRSDSMASVYSAAGEVRYGTVAVRGEVQFGLHYNYRQAALEVLVKQCRDLAPVDVKRNRSDPYVKVYLLPDRSKSGKRKTKVKKHTLCPIFDELLKFQTTLADLEHRTLWLTVWHSDMFGRNDFLGEVTLPLAGKIFDDPTPHWYQLQEQGESLETFSAFSPVHRGDIIVALKYVPADGSNKKSKKTKGSLHVMVKEAKGLVTTRHNGNIDSLCKGTLLPDKGKTGKHKTGISRRTANPVWNNTLIFDDVSQQELAERALELVVWNHDRLGVKEFLGGVRFSLGGGSYQGKAVDWLDSTDKEVTLWQSVLDRANLWCEGSVALRTFAE